MRKVHITILSLFFILFCLGACGKKNEQSEKTLVEVKKLSSEEFANVITNPEVQLIDVRSHEEYNEGNIQGSINISLASEDFDSVVSCKLDKNHPVAVYCNGGRQSKEAADKLSSMGYKVFELNNGYKGWLKDRK